MNNHWRIGFIFPHTSTQVFDEEFTLSDCDAVIGGHSGVPFTTTHDKGVWHNAGSIGLHDDYASTLASGVWPSNDEMPSSDQQRQGHALASHTVELRV